MSNPGVQAVEVSVRVVLDGNAVVATKGGGNGDPTKPPPGLAPGVYQVYRNSETPYDESKNVLVGLKSQENPPGSNVENWVLAATESYPVSVSNEGRIVLKRTEPGNKTAAELRTMAVSVGLGALETLGTYRVTQSYEILP